MRVHKILFLFFVSSTCLASSLIEKCQISEARQSLATQSSKSNSDTEYDSAKVFSDPQMIGKIPMITVMGGELDLFYCWGFVHAKFRGWQMQFLLQAARGTRSEVYGSDFIKADFAARMLDLRSKANVLAQNTSPLLKLKLQAYSDGANEGFLKFQNDYYELKKYPFKLEKWSIDAIYEILLIQSFDQSKKSIEQPLKESKRLKHFKPEFLDRGKVPWATSILKSGEEKSSEGDLKASEIQVIEELSFWDSAKMSGSNNWILAPSRTKSGSAMLANDPHLALKYPAFWFWQVFKSNNGVVIGSSLPGVPIIANGFNGKVAWGLTNAYINAAELFLIKKETVKDIKSRYPLIWIKKWGIKLPMFFKKYHESKSTGLLFPPLENENRDYDTALTWSGFYLNNSEIEPIFDVKNLNSSKEASHLFSKIALPSWNFVFADKAGDIGYQVAGAQWEASNKLGLIEKADLIELQNRKKNLKKGLSLPGIFNPVRGYLVTANNQHSYSNKKYGRAHAQDFRAHQIEKELLEQPKHDNESVSKIQCSAKAPDSKFFLELLVPLLEQQDQKIFNNKNLNMTENCKTCSIYRAWMESLLDLYDADETILYNLLMNTDWKTKEQKPILELFQISKNKFLSQTWSEIHFAPFTHQIGTSETKWNPVSSSGDKFTVNVSDDDEVDGKYHAEHGASMRLIVDLKKNPEIWLAPTGIAYDLELGAEDSLTQKNTVWQRWSHCQYLKYDWTQLSK